MLKENQSKDGNNLRPLGPFENKMREAEKFLQLEQGTNFTVKTNPSGTEAGISSRPLSQKTPKRGKGRAKPEGGGESLELAFSVGSKAVRQAAGWKV